MDFSFLRRAIRKTKAQPGASVASVIREGMTMKEVKRLFGEPDSQVDPYARFEQLAAIGRAPRTMGWMYYELEEGHIVAIMFDDGRVREFRLLKKKD